MCDTKLRLSPIAIFELIEDAASELMGELHIDGATAMREYNAMWVFSKNYIRIFRRPEWREHFEISSYISKHSPLRLFIDTELTSPGGEPLMRSRLEICALDLTTGGLRKPPTLGFREEMEHPFPLPELDFMRFPKSAAQHIGTEKVRSMNLDYCGHTNNVEYVRFILNTFTSEELRAKEISCIEMNYRGQSYEGDTLGIERTAEPGTDTFFITRGDKTAAACRIEWAAAAARNAAF